MAPSSANEDLVRVMYHRWNSGDRDALLEVVDPDTELHSRLGSLRGAPYRGVDGFREWFSDIDEQFSAFKVSIDELREIEPDRVLALGTIDFRGRSSDLPWEQETAWLIDLNQGRLRRMRVYTDREEALRDAQVDR